jgi:hypothetical protein
MLHDCSAELLRAPPGSSCFSTLGSSVHSQRLSFIWSKHTPVAAAATDSAAAAAAATDSAAAAAGDAAFNGIKEEGTVPCDTSMESISAAGAAGAAGAAAAADAADVDDDEDSSVYEDKYARLIGLRATLDKCR